MIKVSKDMWVRSKDISKIFVNPDNRSVVIWTDEDKQKSTWILEYHELSFWFRVRFWVW